MRVSLFLIALSLAGASTALSQDRDPFFEKDSARSVFSDKVMQSDSVGLEFFPVGYPRPGLKEIKLLDKTLLERKDKEAKKDQNQKLAKEDPAKSKKLPIDPKKPLEDQFKEKYGDPEEDQPILAMDNAPKPFQGLMEALQLGREDLAFQYARKYVRYLQGMQGRSMDVVGLVGKALEREGFAEAAGWTKAEQFDRFNKVLEADRAKDGEATKTKTLDDQAMELVQKALNEDGGAVPAKPIKSKEDELRDLRASVPTDPKGEVDVFFFMRINDEGSMKTAKDLAPIYEKSVGDRRINLLGLTLGPSQPLELNVFKSTSGAKFPIEDGTSMARIFEVRETPSVVFVSRNTGAAYFETGVKNSERLETVLKIMQGGR